MKEISSSSNNYTASTVGTSAPTPPLLKLSDQKTSLKGKEIISASALLSREPTEKNLSKATIALFGSSSESPGRHPQLNRSPLSNRTEDVSIFNSAMTTSDLPKAPKSQEVAGKLSEVLSERHLLSNSESTSPRNPSLGDLRSSFSSFRPDVRNPLSSTRETMAMPTMVPFKQLAAEMFSGTEKGELSKKSFLVTYQYSKSSEQMLELLKDTYPTLQNDQKERLLDFVTDWAANPNVNGGDAAQCKELLSEISDLAKSSEDISLKSKGSTIDLALVSPEKSKMPEPQATRTYLPEVMANLSSSSPLAKLKNKKAINNFVNELNQNSLDALNKITTSDLKTLSKEKLKPGEMPKAWQNLADLSGSLTQYFQESIFDTGISDKERKGRINFTIVVAEKLIASGNIALAESLMLPVLADDDTKRLMEGKNYPTKRLNNFLAANLPLFDSRDRYANYKKAEPELANRTNFVPMLRMKRTELIGAEGGDDPVNPSVINAKKMHDLGRVINSITSAQKDVPTQTSDIKTFIKENTNPDNFDMGRNRRVILRK